MLHKRKIELNEAEIIEKLQSINEELDKFQYQLGMSNFLLIKTAVLALIHIVENVERLSRIHNVYFMPVTVSLAEEKGEEKVNIPIHLENYSRVPAEKKNQLLNALPKMFILSYEQVKSCRNKDALAIFASKLDGNCIDARTRMAFDYAAALHSPPCFEEVMRKCMSKIDEQKKEATYYQYFIELSQSCWNMPYSKDKARTSICQQDGFFDFNCFELLANHFDSILSYEDDADFSKYLNDNSVNKKDIPTFLMFALFSSIKFKDIRRASEAFDCLINVYRECYGSHDYLNNLENFLVLAEKIKDLDGSQEHFNEKMSKLRALLAESIDKVLNRWFPPFWYSFRYWYNAERWSESEVQWLAKIFLNENLVQYIIKNSSENIKNIKEFGKLNVLIEHVFKHKGFSAASELLKVFNRIKKHNDYTMLWNFIRENQNAPLNISHADLLKVCKLNYNDPHCADEVQRHLIVLLQQNEDLDAAVSAFKLYLKLSKDNSGQNLNLFNFTDSNNVSLSSQYLDKLSRFLSELPKLKLDRENDGRLNADLNNSLAQIFVSRFNMSHDLLWSRNFIFNFEQKENFVRRVHELAAAIDGEKIVCLMTMMQDLAQENKEDLSLYNEIARLLETLFQGLNSNYKWQFQHYREEIQTTIRAFRYKSGYFAKQGFHEARSCANKLMTDLNVIQREFFEDKTLSAEKFREKSSVIINQARPILEKHRGWGRVLDWLLFIFTGGIGNLLIHGIKNYRTTPKDHYSLSFNALFFRKTASCKQLDKLAQSLNHLEFKLKI